MRMTKKFAVTVVAAVIAAAMLTACGGTGDAGNGQVNIKNEVNNTIIAPGNSGSSESSSSSTSDSANSGAASSGSTAEKPGSESSASSSENPASSTPAEPDKDDHQPEKNPLPANPQSWADSWTKAMYAKRGATDNDLFVTGGMNCHNTHNSQDVAYAFTYVTSDTKSYIRLKIGDDMAQFYSDETGYYEYAADPNTTKKSYRKASGTQEETLRTQLLTIQSVYRVPTTSNVAGYTGAEVNGKWVESITLKDGSSYVYTYSKEDGTLSSLVSKFGDYTFTTNPISITSYTQARYVFSFPTVDTQQ